MAVATLPGMGISSLAHSLIRNSWGGTGGLEMAGKKSAFGVTRAAFSGLLKSALPSSRCRDGQGFFIERVKPGFGPKVLFINGFLSERKPKLDDWKASLQKVYPVNPWYCVHWESKRLNDIGRLLGYVWASKIMVANPAGWTRRAIDIGLRKMGPWGLGVTALGLIYDAWSIAQIEAARTGVLLADRMARSNSEYILCGHSLGAGVVFHTLADLSTRNASMIVRAHLLGGAVGNNAEDWEKAVSTMPCEIVNYHSDNDWVLGFLYRIGTLMTSTPVGRKRIESADSRIRNVDVTAFVSGHKDYIRNFHRFAGTKRGTSGRRGPKAP
jgi:pimeloyl-ACP methyl ester carboxylesterase